MFKINPLKEFNTEITLPGDKSISHRAIMLSSIAKGATKISNFLDSEDTLRTLNVFRQLGVSIDYSPGDKEVIVKGRGKYLSFEKKALYMGESGTTIRLISGILSAQRTAITITSADSLKNRPMARITLPLRLMGAGIQGRRINNSEYPPLKIAPAGRLRGITYRLPVASAQVKSCLLLAGLYAQGKTTVIEQVQSRDHTERMLKIFSANIKVRRKRITVSDSVLNSPKRLFVPSDFSSSAFFIGLTLLSKNSRIVIKNVSINPSRAGLLKVLRRMGAKIKLNNLNKDYFEPYADICVESSFLKAVNVREEEIPLLIDELPLLFVLSAFAKGVTSIYGLKELRVKETDRIYSMGYNLKHMGVKFSLKNYINSSGDKDVMIKIKGGKRLMPSSIKTFSDHRTAMSLIIANLALNSLAKADNIHCISKSFPQFFKKLDSIRVS